jgi:hypothetical protein
MSRRWLALVALATIGHMGSARAGGWTLPPGHFYLQLGTAFTYSSDRYTNAGDTVPITVQKLSNDPSTMNVSNYQQLLTDLYFEVGVFKRITAFGDLPFISARQQNPGGDLVYSTNKFSDIPVGLRGGLLLDPVAIAVEARLTFPSGDSRSPLPTGSGDFRGELRLVMSKAFRRLPIYLDFEMGILLRGSGRVYDPLSTASDHTSLVNFAPQLTLHGEVGGTLVRWRGADRLLLVVGLDYVGSTSRTETTLGALSLYPENSELTTINFTVMGFVWRGLGVLFRATRSVEGLRLPEITTFGGALIATL